MPFDIAGIANQFLNELAEGDTVRDYQHASKTFIEGQYRLAPKHATLYHVFFDIGQGAYIETNELIETGLMVKAVDLPKFTVQNKILNAYNRKNIVQERINYDPVTITFHDDSADIVRSFWQGYYTYYYKDSGHTSAQLMSEHKYVDRQSKDWGYSPDASKGLGLVPYLNAIKIFSMTQKRFSLYTLINPTITSFQLGQHQAGEYTPLEHRMTVAYETVNYNFGDVTTNTVDGFAQIHYDNTPSPLQAIGGGTNSIIGKGGLFEGVSDTINEFNRGNYAKAALTAFRTGNNAKHLDVKGAATAEIQQIGAAILKGQNPLSTVNVPTASSIKEGIAKAINLLPNGSGRINL